MSKASARTATGIGYQALSIGASVLFVMCLLAEAVYCYERPMVSLDTFAYVSIVENTGSEAFQAIGDRCVHQLRGEHTSCASTESDPEVFGAITHYSSGDFQTFLRLYRVKPLYTAIVNLLHRTFGIETFAALGIVSAGSFFSIGLIAWIWLCEYISAAASSLVSILIVSLIPVQNLGKFLLPDALSAAMVLLAAYLLLYRRNKVPGATLLVLLPLARPDNIIFVAIFVGSLIYRSRTPIKQKAIRLGVLALACLIANAILGRLTQTLPYPVLFRHSFVEWTNPSSFPGTTMTVGQYIHALLVSGSKTLLIDLPAPLFLAVLVVANDRCWRPLRDFVLASGLAVAIRVLLFPAMEERYYTWFLLGSAIALTAAVAQSIADGDSWFKGKKSAAAMSEIESVNSVQ